MSETEQWAVLKVTAPYTQDITYIAVDISDEDMKRAMAKKVNGDMQVVSAELTRDEALGLRALLQSANGG
jgi:hypothetical protein